MAVGVTNLPSGRPLHFGNLAQKRGVGQKTRRCVIICRPCNTADIGCVSELLKKQRQNRLYLKNPNARNQNAASGANEVQECDKEDMELLGHLAKAAVTDCPLVIVGTTSPTFIHFSNVDTILDERESGQACTFTLITPEKEHRFSADMSTDYTEWIFAMREAITSGNRRSYMQDYPSPPQPSRAKRSQSFSQRFGLPTRRPSVQTLPSVYDLESETDEQIVDITPPVGDDGVLDEVAVAAEGSEELPQEEPEQVPETEEEEVFQEAVETPVEANEEALDATESEHPVPAPYVPRPDVPPRKRSVTNVRFSDRPPSLISEEGDEVVVLPAVPEKDVVAQAPEVAAPADSRPLSVASSTGRPLSSTSSNLNWERPGGRGGAKLPIRPLVSLEEAPVIAGGLVGSPTTEPESFSDARPATQRSLSRKISTILGGSTDDDHQLGSPRSISKKLSSFFDSSSTSLSRGRGRSNQRTKRQQQPASLPTSTVVSRDASPTSRSGADGDARKATRSRSLVRMFGRSSSAVDVTADDRSDATGGERKGRSRSRSGTRSRSSSLTRVFTLVPSLRTIKTKSLGNMFRQHAGEPEVSDEDDIEERGRKV
ncbi:hypothetical protein HKX48_007963 [Thoreauomyces humboldtii]|nr:hypothetical protein HKX48_007963 [Thoreauomyces humboldtii]